MRSTGFILDGKYIKEEPKKLTEDVQSTYKQYRHDRQRDQHRAEIVQPYKNGKLNPEFKMLYPEESKNYE
jgi:hypothetical protein